MTMECAWDIFDKGNRMKMEEGVFVIGILSLLMSIWINGTLFLTNLRSDLSYRNLAFFTLASLLRCAVTVFSNVFESNSDPQNISCHVLGFWHSFLSVYEVECLTHVCIERYVVAKYNTHGWELIKNHYILYQVLCLLFAGLYSLPPIFGLGRYGLDFSCKDCVLDMVLPSSWDRYVVIIIMLLKSVKSTGFMVMMLFWARKLEVRLDQTEKLIKQSRFTKSVIVVTAVNLVCWMPIVTIRTRTVLPYLLYNEMLFKPSVFCIQWAMWIQWLAPALTSIAIFMTEDILRQKMINIFVFNKNTNASKMD